MAVKRSPHVPTARGLTPLRAVSTEAPPARGKVHFQEVVDGGLDVKATWEVRLLYDGECPLCLKEISMLKKRDNGQDKISFVDIASDDYEPEEYGGVTYGKVQSIQSFVLSDFVSKAMGRIHGLLPDGSVIQGVEVFRRCYDAVGLGWVYAMTSLKPIERIANVFYDIWARYRLPLTGRRIEGIEEMTYWNETAGGCGTGDDEYCELDWGEETDNEK